MHIGQKEGATGLSLIDEDAHNSKITDPGDWDIACINDPSNFEESVYRRMVCERNIWGYKPNHCKEYLYNYLDMDDHFHQTSGTCPGF